MRTLLLLLAGLFCLTATAAVAGTEKENDLEARIKKLEKRFMKVEKKAATDRLHLIGDFRFEVHDIHATMPDFIDGMDMQAEMVQNVWMGLNGVENFDDPIDRFRFMEYTQALTFSHLQQDLNTLMSGMTPDEIAGFNQMLAANNFTRGCEYDNAVLYTTRLRLQMQARVAKNIDFAGRFAMYKPWGESTGIQVFNGQSNSINIDGTTATVPNSDILRVERAYFVWKHIADSDLYLSIGRRPWIGNTILPDCHSTR